MANTGEDRRQQLLERIVDDVVENGINGLTLRRLAAATGSNNRMLLYYFGSREGIIAAALEAAEARFPRMGLVLGVIDDATLPLGDRLGGAWNIIADPANLPFHRLFFQVFGLAGFERERFAALLGVIGSEWAGHVATAIESEGVDAAGARVLAHEVVALWRGLQATLIGLGDAGIVDAAARDALAGIVARVAAAASPSTP